MATHAHTCANKSTCAHMPKGAFAPPEEQSAHPAHVQHTPTPTPTGVRRNTRPPTWGMSMSGVRGWRFIGSRWSVSKWRTICAQCTRGRQSASGARSALRAHEAGSQQVAHNLRTMHTRQAVSKGRTICAQSTRGRQSARGARSALRAHEAGSQQGAHDLRSEHMRQAVSGGVRSALRAHKARGGGGFWIHMHTVRGHVHNVRGRKCGHTYALRGDTHVHRARAVTRTHVRTAQRHTCAPRKGCCEDACAQRIITRVRTAQGHACAPREGWAVH